MYVILDKMTDEEVKICKESSVLYQDSINLGAINNYLYSLGEAIPTVWSEINPACNINVEKLLLKDGPENSRRLELKHLALDKLEEFNSPEKFDTFITRCCNALYSKTMNAPEMLYILEYDLDMSELNLMQSVAKHEILKSRGITFPKLVETMRTPYYKD